MEVTLIIFGAIKYCTCCLAMSSSMRENVNGVFFVQSPPSFAKVKDSSNSFLKAADYSSSSDEVSSSDEDDVNHTRFA